MHATPELHLDRDPRLEREFLAPSRPCGTPEPTSPRPRISLVVPVWNEGATIGRVLDEALGAAARCGVIEAIEIIVVDDGSTDGTARSVASLADGSPAGGRVRLLRHERNLGKGAAVRTGLAASTGDVVALQDGDLEIPPAETICLATELLGSVDPSLGAIFGTRWRGVPGGGDAHAGSSGRRSACSSRWAAGILSWLTNRLHGSILTDQPTAAKCFRGDFVRGLDLRSRGFGICSELTAHVLARGLGIEERPVAYHPRSRAQGKKIRYRHGVVCVAALIAASWRLRRAWCTVGGGSHRLARVEAKVAASTRQSVGVLR